MNMNFFSLTTKKGSQSLSQQFSHLLASLAHFRLSSEARAMDPSTSALYDSICLQSAKPLGVAGWHRQMKNIMSLKLPPETEGLKPFSKITAKKTKQGYELSLQYKTSKTSEPLVISNGPIAKAFYRSIDRRLTGRSPLPLANSPERKEVLAKITNLAHTASIDSGGEGWISRTDGYSVRLPVARAQSEHSESTLQKTFFLTDRNGRYESRKLFDPSGSHAYVTLHNDALIAEGRTAQNLFEIIQARVKTDQTSAQLLRLPKQQSDNSALLRVTGSP